MRMLVLSGPARGRGRAAGARGGGAAAPAVARAGALRPVRGGDAHLQEGAPDAADREITRCTELARRLRHTGADVLLAWWRFCRAVDSGDPDLVDRLAAQVIDRHRRSQAVALPRPYRWRSCGAPARARRSRTPPSRWPPTTPTRRSAPSSPRRLPRPAASPRPWTCSGIRTRTAPGTTPPPTATACASTSSPPRDRAPGCKRHCTGSNRGGRSSPRTAPPTASARSSTSSGQRASPLLAPVTTATLPDRFRSMTTPRSGAAGQRFRNARGIRVITQRSCLSSQMSAASATSRHPASMVSEWARSGNSRRSVTASEWRYCFKVAPRDGFGNGVVLAAGDQQERATHLVGRVDLGRRMGVEVGGGGLEQPGGRQSQMILNRWSGRRASRA